MGNEVSNYQCPNCGGPLHFSSQSQQLECEYCASTFTNAEIEKYIQQIESLEQNPISIEQESNTWTAEEADSLKAYHCSSCGAQLLTDENTSATSCPYCGNPSIIHTQFEGVLKPRYIIPFQLDKKYAVKELKSFYQHKFLLPKAFKEDNHIEEIKGLYVPFWLYSATVNGNYNYHASTSRSHREGDYIVTETDYYHIVRAGDVEFIKVPADASKKMDDRYMDAIEPYDYEGIVDFEKGYLPGYFADRYDVSVEEDNKRIYPRMNATLEDLFRDTVPPHLIINYENGYTNIHHMSVAYALLPVWILSTKWKGKNYLFIMNGQTGKMVGDLPCDFKKLFFTAFVLFIVLSIALFFGMSAMMN